MRITQVRALIVVGVLVLIAFSTSWYAIANDTQTAEGREDCSVGEVPVDLTLPEESEVNVKVFNATNSSDLASNAAKSLEEYGFNIEDTGDSKRKPGKSTVEIHYGPKALAGGHLLRAYFAGDSYHFDINNENEFVDVYLFDGFQQVNTESDARNEVGIIQTPEAPEGTCAIA
ncbi:MAG: LytR C-terminal domain-containing protein [Stackebrandtia sp.]